ncbi:MAG: hypothetical protein RSE29_17120, partial [Leclercia sp.]
PNTIPTRNFAILKNPFHECKAHTLPRQNAGFLGFWQIVLVGNRGTDKRKRAERTRSINPC